MNTELFRQPVAEIWTHMECIAENVDYIMSELPETRVKEDVQQQVREVCESFLSAIYDVRKEVRTLEDKLGMHPNEPPFDPGVVNPDPKVTLGFIVDWLKAEIAKLDGLVMALQQKADEDTESYGMVGLLVTESAVNITKAHGQIREQAAIITAKLDGASGRQP